MMCALLALSEASDDPQDVRLLQGVLARRCRLRRRPASRSNHSSNLKQTKDGRSKERGDQSDASGSNALMSPGISEGEGGKDGAKGAQERSRWKR